MPIRFRCLTCNSTLVAGNNKVGTLAVCPRCRAETIIPSAADAGFQGDLPHPETSPAAPASNQQAEHVRDEDEPIPGKPRARIVLSVLAIAVFLGAVAAAAISVTHDAGAPDTVTGLTPSDLGAPLGAAEPTAALDGKSEFPEDEELASLELPSEHSEQAPPERPAEPRPPSESVSPKVANPEKAPQALPKDAAPQAKPVSQEQKGVKHRRQRSEAELRLQLASVPEVKSFTLPVLNSLVQTYYKTFRAGVGNITSTPLLRVRPDLASLPLISANRLRPRDALNLQTLSRELRALLDLTAPTDGTGRRPLPLLLEEAMRTRKVRGRPEWLRPAAVPVLLQLLMHEDRPVRYMLVDLLADIPGPAADIALAQRAVVDLDADVREAALHALQVRPLGDARRIFLRYLRYPWAPLADHAAEALVYLRDQKAAPALVALLREPDPAGPLAGTNGQIYFQEVVRIPHEANCMMCHPAAVSGQDFVLRSMPGLVLHLTADRATVFNANQLPPSLQGAALQTVKSQPAGGYYSGNRGEKLGPLYIRADVTYFRQDFSLSDLVVDPTVGALQKPRSDYLLRNRLARDKELGSPSNDPTHYEQREAVLWALRELTGKDVGTETAAWVALYPRAESEADAASLADQLVSATGTRREKLLKKLQEGAGSHFTEALALAIPRLGATARDKARATLTERLTSMEGDALAEHLRAEHPEVRRAAALACGSKGATENVADLEMLLDDTNPAVVVAARQALKQLKATADPGGR